MKYRTICCDFLFYGLNHSPQMGDACRHCHQKWDGHILDTSLTASLMIDDDPTESRQRFSYIEDDLDK